MVEVYGIGGVIVFALNIWAIVNIIGSAAGTGTKVIWTLLILLLPLVGFIIWLITGPRGNQAAQSR